MVLNSLRFMLQHPLSKNARLKTLGRVALWQFRSRLTTSDIIVPWIDSSKLVARRGMHGATGNIYYGLHEFSEMSFLLHFLRDDDFFCDIGANVGSYTILASKVVGAETYAFEPDPETAKDLAQNLAANKIQKRASLHNVALGSTEGKIRFTRGKGAGNRVAKAGDSEIQEVTVRRLDDILNGRGPSFIKIDVEGHEEHVLLGAKNTIGAEALQAISTETFNPSIARLVEPYGFKKMFYDPLSRTLQTSPPGFSINNTLLVRDVSYVEDRLRRAPGFRVFDSII